MEKPMDRHQFDAEDRQQQLDRLIDARVTATENDILAGRMATLRAVAELADLNADEEEAEALVRAAVIGHSWLVGARITEAVQLAIYEYVLPLAEADLAGAVREGADVAAGDVYAALVDRIAA
jgi:hypothetical protein